MLKRRQDGRPKFPIFFQKSSTNCGFHGLGCKMPLGNLQKPAKSVPGASQEPFQDPQGDPRAAESRLISSQEASKRLSYLTPDACHTSHLAPDT